MRYPDARAILAAFQGSSSRRALRAAVRVRRTQGRCACDGFPACRIGSVGAKLLPCVGTCELNAALLKEKEPPARRWRLLMTRFFTSRLLVDLLLLRRT